MSNSVNRQIILRSRPVGAPTEENFALVEAPIPEPGAGQFLGPGEQRCPDPGAAVPWRHDEFRLDGVLPVRLLARVAELEPRVPGR